MRPVNLVLLLFSFCFIERTTARTETLYVDSKTSCTDNLRFGTDGVLLLGRSPYANATLREFQLTLCEIHLRTKYKKARYRIHITSSSIMDPHMHIIFFDGINKNARILDMLRKGVPDPPEPLQTSGNTLRVHVNSDSPRYLAQVTFSLRATISEFTPEESCRGFNCYNQSVCVPWTLCNDQIDNCFDGSDETIACSGSEGLGGGALAGIVIGALIVAGLLFLGIFCVLRAAKQRQAPINFEWLQETHSVAGSIAGSVEFTRSSDPAAGCPGQHTCSTDPPVPQPTDTRPVTNLDHDNPTVYIQSNGDTCRTHRKEPDFQGSFQDPGDRIEYLPE